MREHLTRRNILRAAIGVPVAVDAKYITRIGEQTGDLSPHTLQQLNEIAVDLVPHISQFPVSFGTVREGKKEFQPTVNIETAARTLIYLSYLDGGEKAGESTKDFVTKRGLVFQGTDDPTLKAAMRPSFKESDPVSIAIGTALVNDYFHQRPAPYEESLYHELYHLIQEVRDPGRFQTATQQGGAAIEVGFGIWIGTAINRIVTPKLTRRKAIGRIAGVMGGIVSIPILGPGAIADLHPSEDQALLQAGGFFLPIPGGPLLSSKLPFNLKENFLILKKCHRDRSNYSFLG